MALNLELLKEHPYTTGAVVIVGGLLILYLMSSGSGSTSSGSSGDYAASLNADEQLAGVQAGAAVQQGAQQVQLQQAQLEAQVANNQTAASLVTGQTQTAAQLAATLASLASQVQIAGISQAGSANQLIYAENLQSMQDAVLEDQINSGVVENANNNATALAATEFTVGTQGSIASQALQYGYQLSSRNQDIYAAQLPFIESQAGKQYNSALDANNANALFQTILTSGNPAVATAGVQSSSSTAASGNSAMASEVGSVTNGLATIVKGLFG